MRKTGVIWYDKERKKYRVAVGKGQKEHIGRYNTREEAEIALKAATKAYWIANWNATDKILKLMNMK